MKGLHSSGSAPSRGTRNAAAMLTGGILAIGLTKMNGKKVSLDRIHSTGHLRLLRREGHE